ncbi:glutaredoxin family protein [Bacillus sp. MRMR6]|uniref:glutaredoxin family protein n=1 Tax=Bacillus sp. MRMR6 TaxID=1928617 RepID=UPI000950DA83|nr:glutaredoxin family protein [Bacillus sp. MRMR6]OLS35306.1 NrdH-redoxin [Bacillus sp. MRMR6]
MSENIITFYTRKGCTLCDKAKAQILELKDSYPFTLAEIDIAKSDELTERYGMMIPVVLLNGEEIGFGIINKFDISNRLQEKTLNL